MRNNLPIVASFLPTFLKPEMWHIYRQIRGLENYRPVVFAHKRENTGPFPFPEDQVVIVPRAVTRELRRFWYRKFQKQPVQMYGSESRRLALAFDACGASLGHIYFGHMGIYLRKLFDVWDKPLVISFHGADAGVDLEQPGAQALYREVFQRAALVLARSEALRKDLLDLGADPDRTRLNRTSIPVEDFPFKVRRPPADGSWHFVQACRLIPKKGLDLTLRAFADFQKDHSDARLTIAGEGPERQALERLAADLDVKGNVEFSGFLSQEDLQQVYAGAHLFLHPSRVTAEGDREGVPNSLLEAMACGVPVLATTHGGIPEAVTYGKSGRLVPENDLEALKQALREMTSDRDGLEELSRNARQEVTDRFGQAAQIASLEAAYDWVLSRR